MGKNIQISDFIAIFTKDVTSQGRINVPSDYIGHKCVVIIERKEGSE